MKNVVVVGGTAALAKYLIPELSKEYNIISMGRNNCDIYCDLSDSLESLHFPEETDVVILVAASFEGITDGEMIQTIEVNALGTLKVCMAAYRARVRHIIVISSMSATLEKKSPYYSVYSISKKHSEDLAAYYCDSKSLSLTILRPSQIYDAKGEFRSHQPLLYVMADNAEIGNDISIYGANDAMRNYIHVEDLVQIIGFTIKTECVGIYSCINPRDIKLSDIAQAAFSAFNKGGNLVYLEEKNDIQHNVFFIDTSLYDKIGYYPKVDIFEGMKRLSDYRKKNA